MSTLGNLNIKIFADGANKDAMIKSHREGIVKGFTTNPTLMKKDGVVSYEEFARSVLKEIKDLPISFEVFSDDFSQMEKEAKYISSWADNVFVKIPITNTLGVSSVPLIKNLTNDGLKINVTAILTLEQVEDVIQNISDNSDVIVSVFAGRIADTGRDPVPIMGKAVEITRKKQNAEILWASSRELLNVYQAELCGCDIITVTNDILKKIHLIGKDLKDLSLDTVKMFYNDASSAGYKIL